MKLVKIKDQLSTIEDILWVQNPDLYNDSRISGIWWMLRHLYSKLYEYKKNNKSIKRT